jgi:hypothetical protein
MTPESPRDNNWTDAGLIPFWLALLAPLVLALALEMLTGLDWEDPRTFGLFLCFLAVVFASSFYCALWIVSRFMESANLRVFVGCSLVLGFATGYLAFFVVLHFIIAWAGRAA